jgi:hypothetical protein
MIQDKMQEIHHKYGVTEKANYEIQLFIEDLIIKDRAEQLTLTDVSQQRELLKGFMQYVNCADTTSHIYGYLLEDYLKTL